VFESACFRATRVPEVLAFPHADGFGKYTVGGRGGRVIEVTTLEDGGGIPGSLRAAVEAEGPRCGVFKVAGTIELVSSLDIKNPYITIAGQTAPGQGITIKGYTFYIKTGQVIIRNLRFRLGDFA
jgi:pectate lyase